MNNMQVGGKNDGVNEGAPEEDDIFTQDEKYEQEQAAMERELDVVTCPVCKGDGTTLIANDDDENDRDFDNCTVCQGSGELLECSDNETSENEWERLGGTEDNVETKDRD